MNSCESCGHECHCSDAGCDKCGCDICDCGSVKDYENTIGESKR